MATYAIFVRPVAQAKQTNFKDADQHLPVFEVFVSGKFTEGQRVAIEFLEVDARETANDHSQDVQGERLLGKVEGTVSQLPDQPKRPKGHFKLNVTTAKPVVKDPGKMPHVGFVFAPDAGQSQAFLYPLVANGSAPSYTSSGNKTKYRFEGDHWEVQARLVIPDLELDAGQFEIVSPVFSVAWQRRVVPTRFHERPTATYDWHSGNELKFFTDASTDGIGSGGAFRELSAAIDAAKTFIFVVDWSFHPTVLLDPTSTDLRDTVGGKLLKKASEGVLVAINTWYHASQVAEQPNESARAIMQQMATDLKIDPKGNILWRGTERYSSGVVFWSHHQKFVVADNGSAVRKRVIAFYGGLDLTKGRFDSPDHPIGPLDPATLRFRSPIQHNGATWVFTDRSGKQPRPIEYDDWYNGEFGVYPVPDVIANTNHDLHVRQPWHDIHARVDGPIAWDLAREFVNRWLQPKYTNAASDIDETSTNKVRDLFVKTLFDRGKFFQQWETQDSPTHIWSGQLLHSFINGHQAPQLANANWHPARKEFAWKVKAAPTGAAVGFERSIQDSYLRAIRSAERYIHIENQYFIGGGNRWPRGQWSRIMNEVPGAILARIVEKAKAKEPFHVYIVLPMLPEGDVQLTATNATLAVRYLEWKTISWLLSQVRTQTGEDWSKYLSFYFLARADGNSPRMKPDSAKDSGPNPARRTLVMTNKRYMIYVHSKLMIVDDRYVILGSANINERSMAGDRDTEICTAIWPSNNRVEAACQLQIQKELRAPLLHEYLGYSGSMAAKAPESEDFRTAFQDAAKANYRNLRDGLTMTGHLAMYPFDVAENGDTLTTAAWADELLPLVRAEGEDHRFILDGVFIPVKTKETADEFLGWTWRSYVPFAFNMSPGSFLPE